MARSSNSNRSSSFSRSSSYFSSKPSKPSYSYSSPKAPISVPNTSTTNSLPVQHHKVEVEKPGFFSNMWTGFGLGAGQSIAMNMFRSDPKVTHVHENAPTTNINTSSDIFYSKEFTQCLKDKYDDKEACKQYIQCLKDNKDDKSLCKQYM